MYDFDGLRPVPGGDASTVDRGAPDVTNDVDVATDTSPEDVAADSGPTDAGPVDAGPADTGPTDTGPTDTGPMDTGPTDTGPLDAGPMDTGPRDTGPVDTGPRDAGPTDTGPMDTGPRDTGPADTGPLDTGPRDTGPVDTGPVDTGPPPCTGPLCPCAPSTPSGWCQVGATCVSGACMMGTVTGSLVITEIQNDPDVIADQSGEWFEVYNPRATPVDLRDVTVRDTRTDRFTIAGATPILVPAMGYVVIAKSTDTGTNGGVTAVYGFGTNMNLGNSTSSGDEVILEVSGVLVDQVAWLNTVAGGWPVTPGRSKSLRPPSLSPVDNDTGSNWCSGGPSYGMGDFGTPGAANVCM